VEALKKVRITLDLPEPVYQRLNRLVQKTGAVSKAAVLRKAIDLYDVLSKNAQEHGEVFLQKAGKPDQKVLLVIL
jgi:metal-responsive CopG/Arc/MetJ family transcriptional regulator